MVESHHSSEEEPVCTAWARLVEVVLGLFLLIGTGVMAHYYAPPAPLPIPAPSRPALTNDHQDELRQLTRDVDELKQEQAMPALVLNRYRNSICYIYGVYHVSMPGRRPALRARISGTGFVVAEGLLATNRHVAEPWYGDSEADALIRRGAQPELEKLVAFFPGFPLPVDITPLMLRATATWQCSTWKIRRPSAAFVLCRWPAEFRIRENWSRWSAIRWACWAWSRNRLRRSTNGWLTAATTLARPTNWQRYR